VSSETKFKKLFEPGRIGKLEIRNRIVMSPMGTNQASKEGYVTQRLKDHYEERAKGGVGMVIIESATPDFPVGRNIDLAPSIDDDKFIPGMSELAEAVKRHGARVALQICHGGRNAHIPPELGLQLVAPSAVAAPGGRATPQELTVDKIKDIVAKYAKAAVRVKKAGFDGVEIHGAHGYLPAQFLSLASNKRKDSYGGSLENRARFLLEVLRAIREAVGPDYPVWSRMNGEEKGIDNGLTIDEAKVVARMLQDAGADAVHISRMYFQGFFMVRPPITPYMLHLAAAIKGVVSIPVLTVGSYTTPEPAERVLQEGKADFIVMGKALIADPELANKSAEGRVKDIRPCIQCYSCQSCIMIYGCEPVQCRVNAGEREVPAFKVKPAEKSKRVLVIGGGPAGMEAARVAALRGHEVILYEKEHKLGGLANLAAVVEFYPIAPFIRWLPDQIKKLGVKIVLGKEATSEVVEEIKPDVSVLATGGKPVLPQIPGMDRGNVVSTLDLKNMAMGHLKWGDIKKKTGWQKIMWLAGNTFAKFLRPSVIRWMTGLWLPFGKRVVVIGGDDYAGVETARFLAERGRKVTVVGTAEKVASDMPAMTATFLMLELNERGVEILTGAKYEEITESGLAITTKEGKKRTIEADSIALVVGTESNTELAKSIEGKVPEIYIVGDCHEPHQILEAISDSYRIACNI